jgi:CBS domain-containing protein
MKLISDIMSTNVKLTHPHDTLASAAGMMKDHEIGMLPVVEGDRLVGAVTDRDMAIHGVAERADPAVVRISDIMTEGANICYADQTIDDARQTMMDHKVRRVVVLNREDKVAGVLSLGDLAAHATTATSGEALREITRPGD